MPTVYLPAEHSDAELALAERVAEELECSSLYVTWTVGGREGADREAVRVAAPAVASVISSATPASRRGIVFRALGRVATALAAVFKFPEDVERERREDAR